MMEAQQSPPSSVGPGPQDEPAMYLQRPSSARSQDIRHILAKTFRELFTRDLIQPETIENLRVSKGTDDAYHERYVSSLQKIYEEREHRLAQCSMLERHIMQAQARAMSADERELNRCSVTCDNYSDLGIPSGRSHLRSCLDRDLLRKHNLLVPEDYSSEQPAPVPPPQPAQLPSYARETLASQQRTPRGADNCVSPLLPTVQNSSNLPSYLSDDYNDPTEGSPPSSPVEESVNRMWKSHLNAENRETDRADLANLQSKVNFLRNPRHIPPSALPGGRSLVKQHKKRPKEIGIEFKPANQSVTEPSVVFLASPPVVTFAEYSVGQVYEMTLELKNVSTVLRPCRVLPPSTSYFSVGLGQFPGEQGLVAPGMSCHYTVRFNPDSLADYDDVIRVQTQSSTPMVIQLQGRRPAPLLTLPSELDVGYCLVGGLHVVHFVVTNQGGPGRFCLLPTSAWPASNFKSAVQNGVLSAPPFDVRPSMFELLSRETTLIEVAFRPTQVREYTQEMTMVCDNCQVKHFTIKGEAQVAGVKFSLTEGEESAAVPGEICDLTAQHLIKFDELNPFTYTDKSVHIKNITNVELKFQWGIFKPLLKPPDVSKDAEEGEVLAGSLSTLRPERVSDMDSVFSIHPAGGTLPADSAMEFKITFAPPVVGSFNSCLHMLLQQVPLAPPEYLSRSEISTPATGDQQEERERTSDSYLPSRLPSFHDLTALEVEVKGQSVPLNVVLHPYAILLPGKSLVGTTIKKQVVLVNHSYSGVTFHWESYTDDHILEIEPPFGEIGPGMAIDLELSITGAEPGKIDRTLFCYVENLEAPLHLHVEADIKGPEVSIEEPDVNFGLVRLGESITREITLSNMCQVSSRWSIQECPGHHCSEDPMAMSEFIFSPCSGELKPLERRVVVIKFTPTKTETVLTVFGLTVEDGQDCTVSARGEVQVPQACLKGCELVINPVYLEVPILQHVPLLNQTLLHTAFHWAQAEGNDTEFVSIEMEPASGVLSPREELQTTLFLRAHKQGELSDIRIPCHIEGMDKPIYLGLFCEVKGLSVNYKVSLDGHGTSEFCNELEVDYGEETYLGDTPKQYLHICNQSAIPTPFSARVLQFSAKPPTPPSSETSSAGSTGHNWNPRRVTLGRTPNLADPLSRTPVKAYQELCGAMLREGNGAAFVLYPASGELQPFGEEVIEVTGFSDMWGDYSDEIVVKVGDLEPVTIPVKMNVMGCPLNFQLTAAHPDQQPILRFGSHIAGTAPISRKMKVNNSSPFDIRLDWEVYNTVKEDTKLIDFVVCCGQPFPPRDSEGNEIIPTIPAPAPVRRYLVDQLFNSPDLSPANSQLTVESEELATPATKPATPELHPKIVSAYLRAHDGKQSDTPYNVYPKQMVIRAKSHGVVNVRFSPQLSTDPAGVDCSAYAQAYMTLDQKGQNKEGRVRRVQGFEMETLRVEMTSHVKPALLTIECTDEEGMRYRGAMSDLKRGAVMSGESLSVCSAVLSNQTETQMTFRLKVKSPFLLVDLDPSTNSDGETSTMVTDMCTLKPQHNLLVKVGFKVNIDLLKFLDALETGEEVEGIQLDVNNGERKLQFLYDLLVEFNNSAVQKLPLHATLSVPSLILSREALDFGTCLVGQTREMELTVCNKTASSSFWTVAIESQTDTCLPDTFAVLPSSGQLEAHVTYVSSSRSVVKIFFTAKHTEHYEAVFLFQGILGEEPRRLFVRGQGSYDGKHEAIVNV